MLIEIKTPDIQEADGLVVDKILVKVGDRVRPAQVLCHLKMGNLHEINVQAPCNAWIKSVFVHSNHLVTANTLLMILDVATPNEYRPDSNEFNSESELGKDGRRALERAGEKPFGNGFSDALFEAPEKGQGNQHNSLLQHPLAKDMKEGVPPKMSGDAAQNQPAIDKMAEDASHDPTLQKQLSAQLQQQLNITPGPSAAPTLSR